MNPTVWQPLPVAELATELRGFDGWVLCGGHSVALITGKDTREHGDTDIGVLRSKLADCLRVLDPERVFLCLDGQHLAWDGGEVPAEVRDIWITDRARQHWSIQIMVFDDEGDEVTYRRDPRIRWKREHHQLIVDGIRVLNPLITFLFKANRQPREDKDAADLSALIASLGHGRIAFPECRDE